MSEIREARLQKANALVSKGFASYAESFKVSHTTEFLIQKFDNLENGQEEDFKVSSAGKISHVTGGNFGTSSLTINGWLRDFLWSQASQVIQSYGSALSAYGIIFLGAHFIWAFSLMFLFSGRGYWQELIESIVWAHNKLKLAPAIQPRALSITQGRAVGLAHYLLGGIGTTWSFFLARSISVG